MQARILEPELIRPWLSLFLESLPSQRAQIITEQINATIRGVLPSSMTVIGAFGDDSPFPRAAIITIRPNSTWPERFIRAGVTRVSPYGDIALICHGGTIGTLTEEQERHVTVKMKQLFQQQMLDQGIRLLHWTTPTESEVSYSGKWPTRLGFEWLADLDYHLLDLPVSPNHVDYQSPSLRFEPLHWNEGPGALNNFIHILDRTLEGSLDCPRLMEIQTTNELIAAYQNSPGFEPELWFTVSLPDKPNPSEAIGVLMLSLHDASSSKDDPQTGIAEIVYLGLVPEVRGKGLGRAILNHAKSIMSQLQLRRLILAVDQRNHVARNMYQDFGMSPVSQEAIWVKPIKGIS